MFSVVFETSFDDLLYRLVQRDFMMCDHVVDERQDFVKLPRVALVLVLGLLSILFDGVAHFIPVIIDRVLFNLIIQGHH